MSKKSDYFFINVKQIYKNFKKPSDLDVEVWEELLEPYTEEEILVAIKTYRKCEDSPFAPSPAKFREYVYSFSKKTEKNTLPLCPEMYLIHQDIEAGRCKYFYPVYVDAVNYIINVQLKQFYDPKVFKEMTRGERYYQAVERGLFADFDSALDHVYKEKGIYV